MDKARYAAAKAVVRLHKGGWTAGAAHTSLEGSKLEGRDRAFAAALLFGTAERIVTLDYILKPFLKKPPPKLDVEVRAILETGLYQTLYMDIPARAAVNEAVSLARTMGKTSAAGLVNAVLRRASQVSLAEMQFSSEQERICVTYSVSQAVAGAVMQSLPQEYEEFFKASYAQDELCLRANTLKLTAQQLVQKLQKKGYAARLGNVPGSVYALIPGGVRTEESFLQGEYHVQAESSQLACACLGVQPGMKVLDACAAPGGKSATFAQQLGTGTGLTACDVRPNRLPLITDNFKRLGVEGAQVLLQDGTKFVKAFCGQNRILCDVPCSGLGVLRTKPDLRYAEGENFETLPELQLSILENASQYLAPGGRVVYSTCTVRKQENNDVVKTFLQRNEGYRCILPDALPQGTVEENGMLTLLPHRTNLDGFFVATLERL